MFTQHFTEALRTRRFIKFDFDGETYYPSSKGAQTIAHFKHIEAAAIKDVADGKLGKRQRPRLVRSLFALGENPSQTQQLPVRPLAF